MTVIAVETKIDRRSLNILGVGTVCLGVLAILAPAFTGLSVAILLGVLVVMAGLARIYWAVKSHNLGRGLMQFSIGGLTFLAGLAMLIHPIFASGVLTLILILYFLLDGISEITSALALKPENGWLWLALAGVLSIFLAVLLWAQFPLSGAWAMGILLGIKLIMVGALILASRRLLS